VFSNIGPFALRLEANLVTFRHVANKECNHSFFDRGWLLRMIAKQA
jgi:hypothetical protein